MSQIIQRLPMIETRKVRVFAEQFGVPYRGIQEFTVDYLRIPMEDNQAGFYYKDVPLPQTVPLKIS